MPPQFDVSGTVPNITPQGLAHVNPQLLAEGASVLNNFKLGSQGSGSDILNSAQPNQSAAQNRTALQALSGYQQALAGQGGTGGLGGFAKQAEAKGGGILGSLGGLAGGAAAGAALGGTIIPAVGAIPGSLIGAALGAFGGSKAGGATGSYLSSKTGPGQFENLRQSTASTISQASGLDPNQVLSMLPDFGENATVAQTKLSTLQSMLSGGYGASVQPGQLSLPGQQSYGGVGLGNLPSINVGTGAEAPSVGTSLADYAPEALAL